MKKMRIAKGDKMNNRPIKKWQSGNVQAAIFENEKESNTGVVTYKTLSLSRSYKKKDEDMWRNEVIHLRRSDIPKVILVLEKAQEELLLNHEEGDENE